MTGENKTYSGWTNYETWCCNLWLDNDGMSDEIAEWAKEAIESAIERDKSDIRASARIELEDRIKEFIDERAEEWMKDQASMFSDLLNGALQEIDYRDIARHYIDDIKIYSAGWNMPGYMPDSEPAIFTSFESAREYIAESADEYLESCCSDMTADEDTEEGETEAALIDDASCAISQIRKQAGVFSIQVGNYMYWVEEV